MKKIHIALVLYILAVLIGALAFHLKDWALGVIAAGFLPPAWLLAVQWAMDPHR